MKAGAVILLTGLASVSLVPSARADHPLDVQPYHFYANIPWEQSWDYGHTWQRWDEALNDSDLDLKVVIDAAYPFPSDNHKNRFRDSLAHWNNNVWNQGTGPNYSYVNIWEPVERPVSGQNAWRPNCPVTFPVAGNPGSWYRSSFVGVGFRRLNDPGNFGVTYMCIREVSQGNWQRYSYIALNEEIDWYTGTATDIPDGLTDFRAVAQHELGHAMGFYRPGTDTGTTVGGGDDQFGHFLDDPIYTKCNLFAPASWQTMCAGTLGADAETIQVNMRTYSVHDKTAFAEGSRTNCFKGDITCDPHLH